MSGFFQLTRQDLPSKHFLVRFEIVVFQNLDDHITWTAAQLRSRSSVRACAEPDLKTRSPDKLTLVVEQKRDEAPPVVERR